MSNEKITKAVATTILAATAAVALLAPVSHAAKFKAVSKAAGATMNCTVPNHVKCTISSSKGIKFIKIQANTGQGPVYLVNKSYRSCPKNVTVSWDSAYQASNKQIGECSLGKLKVKTN